MSKTANLVANVSMGYTKLIHLDCFSYKDNILFHDECVVASMAVGLRQATKVQIANLTITNCNMERLYGDVFRSNNIVKIIIRDTPIRDIANDTFIGVGEYLQEFQLINSRLKTFPAGAIQALSVVQKIIIDKR